MSLTEIIEFFKAANVKPVKVLRPSEDKDGLDIIIEDDISSFLIPLNAFEIPIVFIYAGTFDEDEFETESNVLGDDGRINLVNIDSKLKSFAKHIGEHCLFELSAPIGNRMIRTMITTEWWDDFNVLKEKALEHIEEREEQLFQRIEREQAAEAEKQQRNINDLLKKLQELSKNGEFCEFALKTRQTQRAILSYAIELLPELNQLDEKTLKDEIITLTDKIRVKKSMKKNT